MSVNKIKYFFSIIVSVYLFHKISKEIYFNVDQLSVLKDRLLILIFFLFLFLPIFYFLSLKLIILLNHLKKTSFYKYFRATIIAYSYNIFLPAKTGDFFRYKFLDLEISFNSFFKINIIEKLISFLILFFLVIISYLIIKLKIPFLANINLSYLLIVIIFFLIVLIITLYKLCIRENFNLVKILSLCLFDLIIWSLQFLQIFIIIKILNIDINFYEIIFIFGSAIITGLIPLSFGGFGVRDYVIFYFLNLINLSNNIFLILLLFNLRYFLPVILNLIISFVSMKND